MSEENDPVTWDLSTVPMAVHENNGPLYVWMGPLLLGAFPWHSAWHVDERGTLHVVDLGSGLQVGEWKTGLWRTCNHSPVP
jgi:hypothetical protein